MGTLRLCLAGTVVLVWAVGQSGAVTAQSETAGTDADWPRVERSVVYGDDDPAYQRLHIFRPEPRENPRPALIWFHGGGLEVGVNVDDTLEFGQLAAGGALGEPYVTFLAGYRLLNRITGEPRWPAQLDDAQRIVRWVRAHADEYNVDPHRICSAGDSSGGHLAAILGVLETRDDSDPELAGISSRVDCAITIAGVVDMSVPLYEWARGKWYEAIPEADIAVDPSLALDASVVHHVDEDTVPMLILHGNRDDTVPIEQSRNLADALAAAGIEYAYAELPAGHGYYGILQEQGTLELMKAFLNYQVHPEQ